jgi:hypothetical protein
MHDKLQSAPNKAIQTWDTEVGAALCGPQQESLKDRRDRDCPAKSLVSKNPSTTLTGRGRRDISGVTSSDGTTSMPDAISPLRRRIQQKKMAAEQTARAQAAAAEQERSHRLASADKWRAARRALEMAVHDANQDFAAEGQGNRFKLEGKPQAGSGNQALVDLSHSASESRVGALSETSLIVRASGHITIRPTVGALTEFPLDVVSLEDWRTLLLDIFERDSAA